MPKLRPTPEQLENKRFRGWVLANMKELRLRQEDIADCLELSKSAISYRINGKREWSLTEMYKLSELFNEQYVVGGKW
jgi:predicted transcriptional regulator